MIQYYQLNQLGDGFVMVKQMENNVVKNYHLMRLSTNEKFLFVIREENQTPDFIVGCQIGPYLFEQSVLTYAKEQFKQMIHDKVTPLFLDEIGILELQGKGFFTMMEQLVASNLEAYIVVRSDLIHQVVEKFGITNYQIME